MLDRIGAGAAILPGMNPPKLILILGGLLGGVTVVLALHQLVGWSLAASFVIGVIPGLLLGIASAALLILVHAWLWDRRK
jgi:hypothetical protein